MPLHPRFVSGLACACLVVTGTVPAAGQRAAVAPASYTVDLTDTAAHVARVEARLPATGDTLALMMPVW